MCASWYGDEFAGRQTACGEIFDPSALTAAHPSLPFGSVVRITNLETGKSTLARINDRGPYIKGVMLDCSHAAARVLGFVRKGRARVRLTRLDPGTGPFGRGAFSAAGLRRLQVTPVRRAVSAPSLATATSPARLASRTARSDAPMFATASAVKASYRVASAGSGAIVAAAVPDGGYCVQLGAFRDPVNAYPVLRQASLLAVPAFLHTKRHVNHVLVGPYADRNRAGDVQRKLERAGVRGYVRPFDN